MGGYDGNKIFVFLVLSKFLREASIQHLYDPPGLLIQTTAAVLDCLLRSFSTCPAAGGTGSP